MGVRSALAVGRKAADGKLGRVTLRQLRDDWTRLGAEDPLWAVYVAPGTRGGRWDVERFFALGRAEVARAWAGLEALGLNPGRGRALDFGCGVGRLSAALAAYVDEVIGVDIAESMLAQARRLDRSRYQAGDQARGRCRFVLNDATDLGFLDDGSIDVVYSSLVLQHMPARLAGGYLREFVRVLAPDGVAVFQVASRPTRSVKGLLFRFAPWPLLRWAQRRLLGYPAPMRMSPLRRADVERMLAGTGAAIVGEVPDETYGGHWHYTRYYVTRTRRWP